MVEDGETETEPLATGETTPTLWSIDAEAVLVVVQDKIEEPPCVIETGRAVKVHVGAFGIMTVIVAGHVTVPPAPVAVRV